jgi:4-amino-4-deoxy-L-arabinose transferase-like glycosyltransferase
MMQTIFAYLLIAVVITAAYPWAAWLLCRNQVNDPLVLTLMLALSIGTLTLVMLWEGVLGISFSLVGITLPYGLVMLPGAILWWRNRSKWEPDDAGAGLRPAPAARLSLQTPSQQARFLRCLPALLLVLVSAAILFNAVYWPFHRADALGIYVPHAQIMYELRTLVPLTGADSLYRAYPMLIPSVYAYSYIASGWENEYLARLVGTLLSIGCLPVAYLLGKSLKDERAGWLSALLLALAPAFGRWASAGYADLPMAFFYGLSAVFALRLWHSGAWQDGLLTGVLAGLAAWTKNAALLGVPLLALWLGWLLIKRRIRLRVAALSLVVCAIVAAPWYIRNQLGAGFLVPDTAWTDQAQRTLNNLFVFLTKFDNFGLSGWAAMSGVVAALIVMLRHRGKAPERLLLLLWALPVFAAWWLFVSYDPRFLLLFFPLLCALGGAWLADVWRHIPSNWHPRVRVMAALVALLLTGQTLLFSVEYKDELLRDPFMSDSAKHVIVGRPPSP